MGAERTYPAYSQKLYLPTNTTQTAQSLTAGRKAVTATAGGLYVGSSTVHRLVPLSGARGAAIQFTGNANNATITAVYVWIATFADYSGATTPGGLDSPSFCDLNYFGATGTVTCGNTTGVSASDLIPTTQFIADTIATWTIGSTATTPKGIGTDCESAYQLGSSSQYSPAGDVPGTLIIPNFGSLAHAFLLEFDVGTATSANALYTLTG